MKSKGKMRINPNTRKPWIRGEKKGNLIFESYNKYVIDEDGYWSLRFITFAEWHRRRIKYIYDHIKKYRDKKTNLSIKYLTDIFPSDFKCPILGMKIKYNLLSNKQDSINIDKINHKKGYIKGNVVWCSNLANRIKTNATSKEILKVGKWLKSLGY
tara:strand:- start:55 stop:522 length:468 start_codon:yes stop_codon:yes gene_type:complete